MKLGLDYHGVIDRHPELFAMMAKNVIADGGEVHIITGMKEDEALIASLKEKGIEYTDIFSITDQLIFEEHGYALNEKGGMVFHEKLWNSTKGDYCKLCQIDVHFDDTIAYEEYFSTPFFLWNKSEN